MKPLDHKDVKVTGGKRKRLRLIIILVALVLTIVLAVLFIVLLPDPYRIPEDTKYAVFISAQDARKLNSPIILDSRDSDTLPNSIKNAKHVKWSWFTRDENSGLILLDNLEGAQSKFRQLGINRRDPVLIYADWNDGYGEEGRLWWTLHIFNITNSYILYGGINAVKSVDEGSWIDNNPPSTTSSGIELSKITVSKNDVDHSLRSTKAEIRALLETKKNSLSATHLLWDVRNQHDFQSGHIPGAKNWYWKNVFEKNNLRSCQSLIDSFKEELGLPPPPSSDVTVISYCLGGIRSAFVYSVMISCGYDDVRNYDGSWWDWSG